ncbi:MAG TPA: hypothetical protein VGY54_14000 [Polyangiaceae bacterium]|nr:hypothetical protein [Polyangiaceae bacterium]
MNSLRAIGLLGLALAPQACSLSTGCLGRGYTCDRTTITVQSPNDAWTPGSYALAMNVDGTPGQCTLDVANPPQQTSSLDCAPAAKTTLTLEQAWTQPPVVCDQNACRTGSAGPIPGHFRLVLVLQGLPKQVALNLTLDWSEILNKAVSPMPKTDEPNGPGCGQCTNAQTTLTVGS